MPRATMREVAKRAGVSQAAVSYALSGRRDRVNAVSEDVRLRVLEAARELGYAPDQAARSLRRRRTERVCQVTHGLGVPSSDLLTMQLQRVAVERGYSVVTLPVSSREQAEHALDMLHRRLADGAVIGAMPAYFDAARLRPLVDSGLPLVVVSESLRPAGFDVVRRGERDACAEAVDHLISGGRRRIAFIAHDTDVDPATPSPRYRAYVETVERRGLGLDPELVVRGADDRVAGYRAAERLLALAEPPDAVFAASDRAAISTLWALRDRGVRVPEEVAVMGVGNIPECEITRPALTSVGPARSGQHRIAELLFARVTREDEGNHRVLTLPWRLIPRGSA